MTEIIDGAACCAEQDQTEQMCRLILFYILREITICNMANDRVKVEVVDGSGHSFSWLTDPV